jgi:hypothetical protein
MKVTLEIPSDSTPIPNEFIRRNEEKTLDTKIIDVINVRFAEEVSNTVEIELHSNQYFELNNSEIIATYDY